MRTFEKIADLQEALQGYRDEGKTIAYVPTMGALHEGHMSLVDLAHYTADVVICSIFVNPTQFNEEEDLKNYPRTIDADRDLLEEHHCDILFHPDEDEVYPEGKDKSVEVDLENLDQILEAEFRPEHFEGVVQVVHRLLTIINPDFLVMGQKDFQQVTIVSKMINELNLPIELVVAPTKREPSGLAMSSRNVRLDEGLKLKAAEIYDTLVYAARRIDLDQLDDITAYARKRLNEEPFRLEYFEIVDGYNLESLEDAEGRGYIVALTAVWVGDVRLIDNAVLRSPKSIDEEE